MQASDADALELVEFPGKIGNFAKRLRFRFIATQQHLVSYLPPAGRPSVFTRRPAGRLVFILRKNAAHILAT
jgi:hypothetical protein